jgi:hypothetical protein
MKDVSLLLSSPSWLREQLPNLIVALFYFYGKLLWSFNDYFFYFFPTRIAQPCFPL